MVKLRFTLAPYNLYSLLMLAGYAGSARPADTVNVIRISMKGGKKLALHHLIDYADKAVLDETLETISGLLLARRTSILLRMEGLDEFAIARATGVPEQVVSSVRVKPGEGIAGLVAQARRPLLVISRSTEPALPRSVGHYESESFVSVPVAVAGQTYGVINATEKADGSAFSEVELRHMGLLARTLAVSIRSGVLRQTGIFASESDELTGLCNRAHFEKRLLQEMERARRHRHSLSVLMIDVDGFRQLNQTHGHDLGNAVLRFVAASLSMSVRRYDVVGRYGGDEFAVLLPRTGIEKAEVVAERIRSAAKHPILLSTMPTPVTGISVAIGASAYPAPASTADELIEQACEGMRLAKTRNGDAVYCWFPADRIESAEINLERR